ncbi:MAG: TonB-dependent receptor [Steroidobacteraceae bacterium]
MSHFKKFSLVAAGVLAALPTVQAAEQETQLEEIVVTARQRAERIEDVPATVQAFTANEIQAAGIERPQDFIALTPGVAQVQTAEAGDLQVVIRGINTGRDAETNFALVIDGVLQTNPNALNQELNNVSQIEVLKGPQGALYGRNAVAGAMIITTRKPGEELEFDFGAGYGQYNSYKANAYLSGPLGGGLRGSISAYTRSTDGQWKNDLLGCDDCVDFFEETGFSGRLIADINGGTLDTKVKYSKLDAGAINFNASLALKEVGSIPGLGLFWEDPNQHSFKYINNVIPQNEQENLNFSIKGDWDVSAGTLTAVMAYNDQTNYFLTDGTSAAFYLYSLTPSCQASNDAKPGNPLPAPFGPYVPTNGFVTTFFPPYGPSTCDGYQYQQRDQRDTSLELRLTSPGDQQLRWVAGAYFADISRDVVVSQGSDNGRGFLAQPLVRSGGANPTDLLYDDTFDSTVSAAFGQLAYDVQEGLEVALALRYDREKRQVTNNVPRIPPQTPGFFGVISGAATFINPAYSTNAALTRIPGRDRTFQQLQPKFSINWKATDNLAFFTSYGVGFRSGGFNSTGVRATIESTYAGLCTGTAPTLTFQGVAANPASLPRCTGTNRSIRNVNDDFEKEVSKAFEAGFKATLLDGSLALNGAVYKTDIEDMQFFNFFAGPFGLLRVVTNAEEAEVQGFELDARWRATDAITLFAGYGSADSEILRYDGRPYTAGNKVPYAPKYTGNAGVDLKLPMGASDWTFNARVDASFVGETWFSTVQDNLVPNIFGLLAGYGQGDFSKQKRDEYYSLNARVGISNGTIGVTAWGRNVTDEQYLQEIIPAPEFGGSFIHDSPGSAFGVDFTYSFR